MSPSQVHAAIKRALAAQLAGRCDDLIVPHTWKLEEFLVHGVKYAFASVLGQITRGLPTAYAAPPLNKKIVASNDPPPVWPDPEGTVRGMAFSPLYPPAPVAARRDAKQYEFLALVDAIRGRRARERDLAVMELKKRIGSYAP